MIVNCLEFLKRDASLTDYGLAGNRTGFAGFGMTYAFLSGYYAAKSIIKGGDYDQMWKKKFLKHLRVGHINRLLWERLSNYNYEEIMDLVNSKTFFLRRLFYRGDLRKILKKAYNESGLNLLPNLNLKSN